MRYKLRTLLIVLALGPVVLAGAWLAWKSITSRYAKAEWEAVHGDGVIDTSAWGNPKDSRP
jgi:hypothetical protein